AAELRDAGADALARPAVLGDREAVTGLVDELAEDGGLHGVVAAGGIIGTRPFGELPRTEWDRLIDVNLTGQFDLVQAAGVAMAAAGGGAIVVFSSVAGRGGRADAPHYAASKAALISLTRSAALAFGPSGVRVNAVCPGVIRTPMWEDRIRGLDREFGPGAGERRLEELAQETALRRLGTPAEIAAPVLFLLSDAAAYVTGQALNVCGGLEFD
ncbi:SDR family NAD(P)-dependent oxidoreductase, partial [Patulibacter sp. S7RM1-6]